MRKTFCLFAAMIILAFLIAGCDLFNPAKGGGGGDSSITGSSSSSSSSSGSTVTDGVWYTIGSPEAVSLIGGYTNGPTNISGTHYPSLEYMKSGNVMNLQGTLHLISAPGQPGINKICVLPSGCAPSTRVVHFGVIYINNGVNVTSAADLNDSQGFVDPNGSVWIGSPHEAITDIYVNIDGGPFQYNVK